MSAIAYGLHFHWLWVPHKVSKYEQRESGKVPYVIGNPSGSEQASAQTQDLLVMFTYFRACRAQVTVGVTGQILPTCSALVRLHTVCKRKGRCREESRSLQFSLPVGSFKMLFTSCALVLINFFFPFFFFLN